jgi:hypothetical protein
MMKEILKKIKITIFNFIVAFEIMTNKVLAASKINIDTGKFKPNSGGATGASKLLSMGRIIVGILQAIGSVVSVVVLIIIAIKYMLGSVEEKVEYKETMKPYIIGCALLFSISNIVGIIYNFAVNM